jgi:hypothetical protein
LAEFRSSEVRNKERPTRQITPSDKILDRRLSLKPEDDRPIRLHHEEDFIFE